MLVTDWCSSSYDNFRGSVYSTHKKGGKYHAKIYSEIRVLDSFVELKRKRNGSFQRIILFARYETMKYFQNLKVLRLSFCSCEYIPKCEIHYFI